MRGISITPSAEHYLKTLFVLDIDGTGVRVSELAAALGVSRASACNALHRLEKDGYVTRTATRRASLTLNGMAVAVEVETAYLMAVRYFTDVLGFAHKTAEAAACALEHVLAAGEWERMDKALAALP